jgi:hypothetical protein
MVLEDVKKRGDSCQEIEKKEEIGEFSCIDAYETEMVLEKEDKYVVR